MPGQSGVAGESVIVSDVAIVAYVGIGHEPVSRTNPCRCSFTNCPVKRAAFSYEVIVTQNQKTTLALILVVLRRAAYNASAPDMAVVPNTAAGLHNNM